MSNNILLKRSSTASSVPTTSDLEYGEVALNYADEKLYFKNSSDEIKYFSGSSLDLGAITESIIPDADETYDLGSSTYKWRDLYLSGNTITLGDATITEDSGSVVIPVASKINVSGTNKQIATVDTASNVAINVPLYTQDSGLSSVAKYLAMASNPEDYTFTDFTFNDGSSLANSSITVFYF